MTSQDSPTSPLVLDDIPFRVDFDEVLRSLRLTADHPIVDEIRAMAGEAESVARPKGISRIAFIESKEDGAVIVEGIRFTSRVLRVNLDSVERVFPFVATCGLELEKWSRTIEDPFRRYCADVLKEMALYSATQALGDHLAATYKPGSTAMMNPGSLDDWPATEQPHLFSLIGDVTGGIGVELSESHVMFPIKSVSGVWFASEDGFHSCQLCPRLDCPKRRAPYDPHLFARKYGKT